MTLLLAIDTSTDQVGLALSDGETTFELSWHARQRQTSTILQGVDHLLGLGGHAVGDVSAVAVAIGPGSFSGLRVGLRRRQGLALARNVPVVGVSTLLVTATTHVSAGRPAVAVVGAGRRRLVWAVVEDRDVEPSVMEEPVNGSPDELAGFVAGFDGPVVVCGEVPDELRAAWRHDVRIACPRVSGRSPTALAHLGRDRWQRGAVDDAVTMEPIYVHLASPA